MVCGLSRSQWPDFANTPGFRGDLLRGYELAVQALVEQLPGLPSVEVGPVPNLVNLWGIIPQHDLFWQGDLIELTRPVNSG